jgi:hypothetical protein
MLKFLV